MVDRSEHGLHRRVTGHHDMRLDGISDVLCRANGTSVVDIGCNRGMAGYEFYCNGSILVHGVDIHGPSIDVARAIFADIRNCKHKFEVLDLNQGIEGFNALFGSQRYDITLLLAINHKLRRQMAEDARRRLITELAHRSNRYIAWRGYDDELVELDEWFARANFKRIQYSTISETICPSAIWRRS